MNLLSRSTPRMRESDRGALPEDVAALARPVINGIPQGVLVRGRSVKNPALLILHGGPGGAYIGCARSWFGCWEDQWVVLNWDMRGAGLSYSRMVDPSSLEPAQIARDALGVVEWSRQQFGLGRFYLLAHSFGTLVAPHVLHAAPNLFEGYVAVAPAPIDAEAEGESYQWTLARARERGNRRAIGELERIGSPPYRSSSGGLDVRARWTDALGGAIEGTDGSRVAFRALRAGTEYTWGDLLLRFLPGVRFWMRNVDESFSRDAASERLLELPVPTTVVQGTADWMAPAAASRRYFERIRAPRKSFVELANLGHYPFVEEPNRFARVLTSELA